MKYKYQRIRDLREDADLTQKDIADKLNEHLTTYVRWESGETELPIHILKKLCEIYKVSADYIIGITDIKRPMPNEKGEKIETKTIKITGYNINVQNL